jgi:hypothetical protein
MAIAILTAAQAPFLRMACAFSRGAEMRAVSKASCVEPPL